MPKLNSECTPEEALLYVNAYFATNDLLTTALAKFERLIIEAPTSADRSKYRAESLHAERALELLRNKRRAFLDDKSAMNPPSKPTVDEAIARAKALAETTASQKKGDAIIDIVAKGLEAFAKIQDA